MFFISDISGNLRVIEAADSEVLRRALPVKSLTETSEVEDAVVLKPQGASLLLSPLLDAQNIGRAGALQTYRLMEAAGEETEPEKTPETDLAEIQASLPLNEQPRENRGRVNPISAQAYYQLPQKPERKPALLAADIMSSPVFTLSPQEKLSTALAIFSKQSFRHIPLLSEEAKVCGILSDRDLLGYSAEQIREEKILAYMRTNVLTASTLTPIQEIAQVMLSHHIGCLPLIAGDKKLSGILTRSDILRAIVNRAPIELWT